MAPHWKCGSGQPVAGSNPALSATLPAPERRCGVDASRVRSRASGHARSRRLASTALSAAPSTPGRRLLSTRATPPRRATRPSCHPTMKYADTDDLMARVRRLLPPNEAIEVRTAGPDARYAGSTVAGPAASGHTVVAMRDVHDRLARGARRRRPPPLQVPCRARLEHPAFRMTADTGNLWRSAAEWGSPRVPIGGGRLLPTPGGTLADPNAAGDPLSRD